MPLGQGRPSGKSLEDEIEMIRTQWFKNHKAVFHQLPIVGGKSDIYLLDWRNPESWNYAVRYIIWSNTLSISGDLGEAAHQWGQHVTFPWIAGCNLGYYHGKCQASESGRDFVDWDRDLLKAYLSVDDDDYPWYAELREAIEDHGSSQGEWNCFLHEFYSSDSHDIDTEELIGIASAGCRVALRCVAHWVGIKMAVESLKLQDRTEGESICQK